MEYKARLLSTGYLRQNIGLLATVTFEATAKKKKKKGMNMSRGHNNWNLNLKFSAFPQKRIHTDQYSI